MHVCVHMFFLYELGQAKPQKTTTEPYYTLQVRSSDQDVAAHVDN